jgi:hypothetical protein
LSLIEKEFLAAEKSAQDVAALTEAIARLPVPNRRQLVFLALSLVEGGKASPRPTADRQKNARPNVASAASAATAAKKTSGGIFRTNGARRTQAAVRAQANALHAEVARSGGRGIEQLAKALGTTTHVLALPMITLLKEGRVKKVGERRGTKYTAGGKAATAPATSTPAVASKRPSRGRGSSVDAAAVLAEVKRQGGRSSEAIAKSLKVAPRQLRSSLVKLIEAKKIKTKGKKRGMRYTAA